MIEINPYISKNIFIIIVFINLGFINDLNIKLFKIINKIDIFIYIIYNIG